MQEDEIKDQKNFFSKMTEEETNDWLKKLNLEEGILTEILKIVKNGKDLISLYNDNQLLEKLNLDLHNINIINDAIEESLEEQLKINIEIDKDKIIIIDIENDPKYKLKEVINYLEKLMKRKIFLSPKSNSNEILNPNTLIQKKILLNPNKYCNLCLFNENILPKSETKDKTIDTTNTNNTNKNTTTPNINIPDLINNKKDTNKGYTSLFQNKKKNLIADFNTDYQMPSLNNNKLNEINNKNITNNTNNTNNNNDFKYQNLLLNKDKENKFKIDFDISNNNNINTNTNNNTEQKKGFGNFNLINNTDTSINKNYFTQRNFNTKNFSLNDNNNNNINNNTNNDNGDIFSKITNLKIIDRTKNINPNNNNLENITNNSNSNNKTENRYEFVKYQDLDIFKNNTNTNNSNNTKNLEVNDINNLIIKTQTPNLANNNTNNKLNNFQLKEESDDILKSLREKYSLQNNGSEFKDMNNNLDYKKDYKPKTPIAEGRRTFNNENMNFNIEDNSNDPLENKFLNINRTIKNDNGDKYSFLNKNKINMFNINDEEGEQNNKNFGGIPKMRNTNRPSPGLDFNNFQYKALGYKNTFGQNTENEEQADLNEDMNNI